MRHRTYLTGSASLLVALALDLSATGCGSSPSGSSSPTAPSVAVAKANLPRDAVSALSPSALPGAVAANNAFAVDLYGRVRATSAGAGNLLTSPLSASLALGMTYAGAQGQTATEMAAALHLGGAAGGIFDGQNALGQALAQRAAAALATAQNNAREGGATPPSASNYELQVVNSVWGEKTYTWQTPFLDVLARSYGTGVYQEDFVHSPDPARQTINAWVSSATSDKINDLIPAGDVDSSTRMVLVNAIHLKLPWLSAFTPSATASASFTRGDGSAVQAPFMHQTLTARYVDDGQAQIVSLPLEGGAVSVLIAVPHGDLASYEAGLTAGAGGLTVPAADALVTLSLPKLSFTSPTFSLASALQAMGMKQAFDPQSADFKGLCASPPDHDNLYIADVLQKAMLGMQETGVEAAAATAVLVAGSSVSEPQPPPVTLVVDRPFVVSIVDVPTGALLFLGHIADPTASGG